MAGWILFFLILWGLFGMHTAAVVTVSIFVLIFLVSIAAD